MSARERLAGTAPARRRFLPGVEAEVDGDRRFAVVGPGRTNACASASPCRRGTLPGPRLDDRALRDLLRRADVPVAEADGRAVHGHGRMGR